MNKSNHIVIDIDHNNIEPMDIVDTLHGSLNYGINKERNEVWGSPLKNIYLKPKCENEVETYLNSSITDNRHTIINNSLPEVPTTLPTQERIEYREYISDDEEGSGMLKKPLIRPPTPLPEVRDFNFGSISNYKLINDTPYDEISDSDSEWSETPLTLDPPPGILKDNDESKSSEIKIMELPESESGLRSEENLLPEETVNLVQESESESVPGLIPCDVEDDLLSEDKENRIKSEEKKKCEILNPNDLKYKVKIPKNRVSLKDQTSHYEQIYVQELIDNYSQMEAVNLHPHIALDILRALKVSIINGSEPIINLEEYEEKEPKLSSEFEKKIRRTFESLFGTQGKDWSFEHLPEGIIKENLFPKGRLLATLDHLVHKYQSLSDDRKLLDFGETIGQELAETIEDYSKIRKKMESVWDYVRLIRETKNSIEKILKITEELNEELNNDESVKDMIDILDEMVMNLIEKQVMNKLKKKKISLQSKFDYYQKLSEELRRMTHIPEGSLK